MIDAQGLLVTPAPFNTVLWRLVATTPTQYFEGHYSLLDAQPTIRWTPHDRGAALIAAHGREPMVAHTLSSLAQVGFDAALSVELADGLLLRHLSAPHFFATKFEAFKDRGQNDVYLSHDLEDIMTVMEGRSSVVREMAAAHASGLG